MNTKNIIPEILMLNKNASTPTSFIISEIAASTGRDVADVAHFVLAGAFDYVYNLTDVSKDSDTESLCIELEEYIIEQRNIEDVAGVANEIAAKDDYKAIVNIILDAYIVK